jgi:hypothetical protein
MVIYDSRVVQRNFTGIRTRFRRTRQEPQIELGSIDSPPEEPSSQESGPEVIQVPETVRVNPDADANPATGVKTPHASRTEQAKVETEAPVRGTAQPIRAEEAKLPYSLRVGLSLLCFFLVSFIVIMVVRGVVDSLPLDFRFFANIYLAGTSPLLTAELTF